MRQFILSGALLVATSLANATVISYVSGSTAGGEAVSATATITILDSHDFTISLDNTYSDIHDAGQLLTDLEFNLTASGVTMTGSGATIVNIDGSGVPTKTGPSTTGWSFGANGSNSWELCVICVGSVTASATPTQGIVPDEASYAAANNSIKGNNGHNPFLDSGATFDFSTTATLPTDGSNPFSNVVFSFSSTPGVDSPGTISPGGVVTGSVVPEPLSLILSGAGLIGLSLLRRRRQA